MVFLCGVNAQLGALFLIISFFVGRPYLTRFGSIARPTESFDIFYGCHDKRPCHLPPATKVRRALTNTPFSGAELGIESARALTGLNFNQDGALP